LNILNVTVLVDAESGGGTAERTLQLSRALVDRGHEVTVLSTSIGLNPARIEAFGGARVIGLPCLVRRFFIVWPRLLLIASCVRRADVVHLVGHWNLLNVWVYVLTRIWRRPYALCPAGELQPFGRSQTFKRLFNAVVGHRIVRAASAWIAVTPNEIPHYTAHGISPESVTVLPNGIVPSDLLRFQDSGVLEFLGVQAGAYVLYMGRLNPIKGPDLLLEAFAGLPSALSSLHLVLAGPDSGMGAALRTRAAELGLADRVHLPGYVFGADKATLYRHARLLAIPSRYDAMSIVVLEAGVVGVPVLLTDQCGFDEVSEVGAGYLVTADVAALRGGLQTMLLNVEELTKMGHRLHGLVREKYTWDRIVRFHEVLFENMQSGNRVRLRMFDPGLRNTENE
jgi:glycosyltransferase involved in cell wall biosynthesis